jgi:hypothetical protein
LGNTPLRAADIELNFHCFGGEQWSELYYGWRAPSRMYF